MPAVRNWGVGRSRSSTPRTGQCSPSVVLVATSGQSAKLFLGGLADYLANHGYDVAIVANDIYAVMEPSCHPTVKLYQVAMTRNPSPVRDLFALVSMVRLLKRLSPDGVLYGTPKASVITALAGGATRVPVRIYSMWGIRLETTAGLARRLYLCLERVTAWASTLVLANSPSLAARAVELGITECSRIVVPGNGSSHGVDFEKFDRKAEMLALDEATDLFLQNHSGFTIGFVGRVHPDKGVEIVLEAAGRLTREGISVRVLLVGANEGLTITAPEGLPVHQTGSVKDVRPYLQQLDVLALMSLREGFPNVVLEAAAMGIPAVVSDATGCVDSVVDGVTGCVVPTGDSDSAAAAFRLLATNPGVQRKFGCAARERAVVDFAPNKVWEALESIIREQLRDLVGKEVSREE